MSSIITRTLPTDHITPVRAYAALRAVAREIVVPARVGAAGRPMGRYAVLGYRARSEGIYPSGFDPFEMLRKDLADLGVEDDAQAEARPTAVARWAAGLAEALVGFIEYDALHRLHDVDPWPNEDYLARVMKDATVVVFDAAAQTMTLAGPSQGALNRCAWEMTHGPELQALDRPDVEALPEDVDVTLTDDAYAVKAARARQRIAAGQVSGLVLSRTFKAPLRGADPLDVYRALRLLAPSRHLYFLDFTESPFAPGLTLVGASGETLIRRGGGVAEERSSTEGAEGAAADAEVDPIDALRAAFTARAPTGAPQAAAAKIIRELEAGPRHVHGGAVGYFGRGGALELAAARQTILLRHGYFEVTAGAELGEGGDAAAEAEATRSGARVALAAIRAAHDAVKAREAAAERKAAAEKAAVEKAAAEKEAAEQAAAEKAAAEQAAAEQAVTEQAARGGGDGGEGLP